MIEIKRLENENEEQFIWRLGQMKDSGLLDLDWEEIADIINSEFREEDKFYKEASYRKPYQQAKRFLEAGVFHKDDKAYVDDLITQKQELYKERQKIRDERTDLNKKLRNSARYEEDISSLKQAVLNIGKDRYVSQNKPIINRSKKTMIVCLSDLHIGAEFYNFNGCYNIEIAKNRLFKYYLNKIIEIKNTHDIDECVIVGLGDFVSGSIHKSIAITNRLNVIEQIKEACELISDFTYELCQLFSCVNVYSVSGNHSRLDKKDDALTDERLDMIIPWFLKNVLHHIENVYIHDDNIDSTLCTFFVKDKLYFACHGDYDRLNESSIFKLISWAGVTPYCILVGHKHSITYEMQNIKIVQSGSLCGSGDNFTREKRLSGTASQTILVCDDVGKIDCIYNVEFDRYEE